jgi:hypothetical protein
LQVMRSLPMSFNICWGSSDGLYMGIPFLGSSHVVRSFVEQ